MKLSKMGETIKHFNDDTNVYEEIISELDILHEQLQEIRNDITITKPIMGADYYLYQAKEMVRNAVSILRKTGVIERRCLECKYYKGEVARWQQDINKER